MNDAKSQNKALHIFRWVGFLPAAFLAAWLAWLAINLLGRFGFAVAGITPEDFFGKLYFIVAGHTAMGAALVYTGTKIVPSHKLIVAFILAGLGIITAGVLLFPAIMVKDWWAVLGGIFVAIGAGVMVWSINAEEVNVE